MVRPTLIGLNPVELKYYPFMSNLDKCTGSCNVLLPKICVSKNNMITNQNEAKSMDCKCDCKCKLNSTSCNSNQKWNNKTCHCECKSCSTCQKYYIWNPSSCICKSGKY